MGYFREVIVLLQSDLPRIRSNGWWNLRSTPRIGRLLNLHIARILLADERFERGLCLQHEPARELHWPDERKLNPDYFVTATQT